MSYFPDSQVVVDPVIKLKGGGEVGKKHEICLAAFGGHLLLTYFYRVREPGGVEPGCLPSLILTQIIHGVQGLDPGCLTSLIHIVSTWCTGCGTRMSYLPHSHSEYIMYRVWNQDVLLL